jgi:hypothetical protein
MYVCFLLNNTWCEAIDDIPIRMTFKILMDDTLKVIHRSNVRSALNPHAKNLRLDSLEPGNVAMPIIKSRHDSADDGEILPPMPIIDPLELIGRTFLMDKEDGQ